MTAEITSFCLAQVFNSVDNQGVPLRPVAQQIGLELQNRVVLVYSSSSSTKAGPYDLISCRVARLPLKEQQLFATYGCNKEPQSTFFIKVFIFVRLWPVAHYTLCVRSQGGQQQRRRRQRQRQAPTAPSSRPLLLHDHRQQQQHGQWLWPCSRAEGSLSMTSTLVHVQQQNKQLQQHHE